MDISFIFQEEFSNYLRTASLGIAFVLLVVWGDRETWMSADIAAAATFGAAFAVFPNFLLDFQVEGKLDSTHLLLGRMLGMVIMCSAIVWWFTRETRDGTVPISLMMSRVFGCSVFLLCQVYTYWGTSKGKKIVKWNDQFVWFGMFGTLLWLLGNLTHLLRSHDFSTYPQHNIRINHHLRIDAGLLLLSSISFLAFPDFIVSYLSPSIKTANCVHLHVCRCIGTQALGAAIVSLQATGFLHERDKRAQFLARIIEFFLVPIPLIYHLCFVVKGTVPFEMMGYTALVYAPILINAMIGYFTDGTVIYRVEPHKEKPEEVEEEKETEEEEVVEEEDTTEVKKTI